MLKSFQLLLLAFGIACITGPAPSAHAIGVGIGDPIGLSPFWDWKTLESPHFRITFPAELGPQAHKTADYLEEAHRLLTKRLLWTPALKTQILVIDNADSANGLTSAVARFGIILYLTPPDNWFSTAYYDNWLRLLCIHEYTHMINMDPTRGFYAGLRFVFGDIFLPNSLWPTWMLEGLAVYEETALTRGGRGRSPYYEMILRASVEEKNLNTPEFITIDKVNGNNPYYPGGETPYVFGYQLMNHVETDTEDALGVMSYRSSLRVPFFINGNLENITEKDWYQHWAEFVAETNTRAGADLLKIQRQPVSALKKLPETRYGALGATLSPDGKWLAYTQSSSDEPMGLYLKDLKTGTTRRVRDKVLGVGMAFTPDSKALIYSELQKISNYYLYSDLEVYNLEDDSTQWLTHSLRARDPDVSRDGRKIVFTTVSHSSIGISTAALIKSGDEFHLGPEKKIYHAALLDLASNPKFSPDGESVIFTLHRNGFVGEDLVKLDLASDQLTTLISDQHLNRYPFLDKNGVIYFISDKTGVDNIYRLGPKYSEDPHAEQVTNVTTGVWMPAFAPDGSVYASVFSTKGWGIAQIQLSEKPFSSEMATVSAPPAPPPYPVVDGTPGDYKVSDYSVFPSILPRQWAPILLLTPNSTYLGGEILGYDAVDRHQYLLAGAYDSETQQFDTALDYANRSLGVTFEGLYTAQTTATAHASSDIGAPLVAYRRKSTFTGTASFPFQWTHSSLTPVLGINTQRETSYSGLPSIGFTPYYRSRYVPSSDATLFYSNAESSSLAIIPEAGRSTMLGTRVYSDSGIQTVKAIASDNEYLNLGKHVVLSPSIKGGMVTHTNGDFLSSNLIVSGRIQRIINTLPPNNYDQLAIRGYPDTLFAVRSAVIPALDLDFPVAYIFRGWGTNPFFLDHLNGFVFGESTIFPGAPSSAQTLPSAGGGLRANVDLFVHLPLILALEYHKGFNQNLGGMGEVFFDINLGAISF